MTVAASNFVTVEPATPLEVKASDHPGAEGQFWVEGRSEGVEWRERFVSFSGYYGSYGPQMFAAAPDLVEALRPFAKVYELDISTEEADADLFQVMRQHNRAPKLTVGDFRRAYQALMIAEDRA